jgi:hypothetical protein
LTTASLFLFQTPVPSYKDVDLFFTYEHLRAIFDFTNMDQTSGYDFARDVIPFLSKIPEIQLSSTQIQEFMRFAKRLILIPYAGIS